MNISLVLSRKNLFDSFNTLSILNTIAAAGLGYITVFMQRMYATSEEIKDEWVLRPEDAAAFREKMHEMKPHYKNLRIGLVGDLSPDFQATAAAQAASAVPSGPILCDKPYYDRYVTIDGYLSPCCIMTDGLEWKQTPLDQPLENIFTVHPMITGLFKDYERKGHPNCENCNLISPLKRQIASAA